MNGLFPKHEVEKHNKYMKTTGSPPLAQRDRQTYTEIRSHLLGTVLIKKTNVKNTDEDAGDGEET